jgi:hypothetical protein
MTFPSAGGRTFLAQGQFSNCQFLFDSLRMSMFNIETIGMKLWLWRLFPWQQSGVETQTWYHVGVWQAAQWFTLTFYKQYVTLGHSDLEKYYHIVLTPTVVHLPVIFVERTQSYCVIYHQRGSIILATNDLLPKEPLSGKQSQVILS